MMRIALNKVHELSGPTFRIGKGLACKSGPAGRLLPGLILLLCLASCDSSGGSSAPSGATMPEEVVEEVAWPEPELDESGDPVPADIAERRRVDAPLAALIQAKDFAGIEAIFDEARRTRASMLDGARRLSHYYSSFPNLVELALTQEGEARAFYEQWAATHPDSPVPLILLARLHIDQAWASRGSAWGSEVSKEGWKGFERELDLAEQILHRARRLDVKDAELAAQLITVHMGKNHPVEDTRRVFEEGFEIDPMDLGPYQSFMVYLLPRWHGEAGELEAFAAEIADRIGGEEGDLIYTRIVRMTYGYVGESDLGAAHEFDWARVRRGYAEIRGRYPGLPKYYAQEAELASSFGDRAALENAARALGPIWREHYLGEAEQEAVLQRYNPQQTELRAAAKQGDLEEIDRLLEAGADVNARGRDGQTVLRIASADRDAGLIRFLLSRGADANVVTEGGWTPLTVAVYYGDTETAEALLDGGANPNFPEGGRSPLYKAIERDQADVARLLLERGAQHAVWYEHGRGPLHRAVEWEQLDVARVLLLHGADPNAVAPASSGLEPFHQRAPLHSAVENGNTELIELLMRFGADPDLATPSGATPRTVAMEMNPDALRPIFDRQDQREDRGSAEPARALDIAIREGDLALARALIEQGADVNKPDPLFHQLPLQRAASRGNMAMVSLLIERGAKLSALPDGGAALLKMGMKAGEEALGARLLASVDLKQVPERFRHGLLASAVSAGRKEFVALALEAGYDVNGKDAQGETLLRSAALAGRADLVGMLTGGGADPNVASNYGWMPLHVAIHHDQEEAAVALIEGGADPNAVLDGKWTPLSLAMGKGREAAIHSLVKHGADLSKESFGRTPLFSAAGQGKLTYVQAFLEAGADPNVPSGPFKATPLQTAVEEGRREVVEALLAAPTINLDAVDARGLTPLHGAVNRDQLEMARMLLDAGARRDALSDMKQTPLDLARQNKRTALITLLE